MATRTEVHAWLKHASSGGSDIVGNKVGLAVRIYLGAQPKIPDRDLASLFDLELGAMGSAEGGGDVMQLCLGGKTYLLPRLPDVFCCPVSGWSMEMFSMMMPAGGNGGPGLDAVMGMMSKKVFSRAGDGSEPVLTQEEFCRKLGAAMESVDGIERKGDLVLSHLSRTREVWDSSEDERGVSGSALPPGRSGARQMAEASMGRAAPGAPAAATEGGGSSKVCSVCGKGGKTLSCSRCKLVRYCSVECQKSNWKLHKPDCRKA